MRFRSKLGWLHGAMFPLALFAFAGVGMVYIGVIFTPQTRWVFLALFCFALLKAGRLFGAFKTKFGVPLLLYCAWCLLTSLWSIVPELSLLKGFASIVILLAFTTGGRYWAYGWTSNAPLTFLVPIAVVAVLSAFGGTTARIGDIELYQGLTGNPNYLGLIVAASLPVAFYFIYWAFTNQSSIVARVLSILMGIVLASLLWRAASRASISCAACETAFAIAALRPTKMIMIGALAVGAAVITFITVPAFEDQVYTRFIVKYSPDGDVFYSRREPWRESLEGARQGGWIGLGYGASYGDTKFSGGLTSVGYGREKGSSQLAVVEETGLVGAAFYALLIYSIFRELFGGLKRAPNRDSRMELALISGLAVGILFQSIFEAWWTAPGSLESAIFWSTVGVGSGLVRRAARARARSAIRRSGDWPLDAPVPYQVPAAAKNGQPTHEWG